MNTHDHPDADRETSGRCAGSGGAFLTHGLLAALFWAALGVAQAQAQAQAAEDDLFTKAYHACMTKSGGVTASMRACMATELKLQDKRLNVAYQKLMGQQQGAQKTQLQEAQRAWLRFRDLNCAYHAGLQGGTMSAAVGDDCHLSSTAARARELESVIQ